MEKNPNKAVLALSFVSAVALLILNLQPLFIGSAQAAFGFSEIELGAFASWPIAASFLVFVSAPLWLERVSIRTAIIAGSVIAVIGLAAMANSSTLIPLTAFFAVYAAGISIVQVPALVALGRMPDAEAAFGIYTAASVILAGAFAFFIPAVIEPTFGFNGIVMMMLAATIVGVAIVLRFSDSALQSRGETQAESGDVVQGAWGNARGWVTLAGLAAFYMAILAAWPFLEIVGRQSGLDGQTLGIGFASGLLLCGVGPLVAARYGESIPLVAAMAATAAMFLAFVLLLSLLAIGPVTFGLALILFLIAWNFGIPYMLAVASRVDDTGQALALAPAAMTFGAALGPTSGAYALAAFGPAGLFSAFGAAMAISMVALLWADRTSTQRDAQMA